MQEPFLSQFRALIRSGAAGQDIHDAGVDVGYASSAPAVSNAYVHREVERVRQHQQSLCPLLERYVGLADRVLDVGCNTGAATVALTLADGVRPTRVVGVDPNERALAAAAVRARGYGLKPDAVSFVRTSADARLPFPDAAFDLTLCVSVLEFVTTAHTRFRLVREMCRVTRPGGYVYVATPNPFRLRELHSGRILGDFRRRVGHPWSSTPRQVRDMFRGCHLIPLDAHFSEQLARRLPVPWLLASPRLARAFTSLLRWQRWLVRIPQPDVWSGRRSEGGWPLTLGRAS